MFPEVSRGLAVPGAARRVPGGPELQSPGCSTHGSAPSTLRKCWATAAPRRRCPRGPGARRTAAKRAVQERNNPGLSDIPAAAPPQVPRGSAEPPAGVPCRAGVAPASPRLPTGAPRSSPAVPAGSAPLASRALRRHLASERKGEGRSGTPGGGGPSSLPLPSARSPWEKAARSAVRPGVCSGSPARTLLRDSTSSMTPGHRTASGVAFRGLRLPGEYQFRGCNGKEQKGVFVRWGCVRRGAE